jgi:dihydrofolate synthase/folylpolyglutamate synthase
LSLDHTALLGDTELQIAAEKLAVVCPGGVLVLGATRGDDVRALAASVARRLGAQVSDAGPVLHTVPEFFAPFQRRNFAAAATAATALIGPLSAAAVQNAAANVRTPGRLHVIGEAP